jgi:hypothetical protein
VRPGRTNLRQAAVALVIGALVTIALSWLAMFLPRGNAWNGPRTDNELGVWAAGDGKLWQMSRGHNAWHTVVSYWHMQISGLSLSIPAADYEARKYDFSRLPRRFRPESLDELNMSAWYHETGWPFGAMSCSVHWKTQVLNSNVIYTVRGGVQLARDAAFNPRALPLTPVWAGFGANTLLFATGWLVLGAGVGGARRRRRERRGLCARCGYSRGALADDAVCPECGGIARGR